MKMKKKCVVLGKAIKRIGRLGHIEAMTASRFILRDRSSEIPGDITSRLEASGIIFWNVDRFELTDVGMLMADGRLTAV